MYIYVMTDNAMITDDATIDILLMMLILLIMMRCILMILLMLYMYIYMDTTRREEGNPPRPGSLTV